MSDLDKLVLNMSPCLNRGVYAYCTISIGEPIPQGTICWFTETEGTSIILPIEVAERSALSIGFQAEWITLEVLSDLSIVGLTAAVSGVLAKAAISCNIVAGYYHDHLFVPAGKGQQALSADGAQWAPAPAGSVRWDTDRGWL